MLAFLMLLFGIIDVARYLFTLQSMDALANRAVRAGVANSTFALGGAGACPVVSAGSLPFPLPPFLDPNTTLCVIQTVATGGNVVTVTVAAPFDAVTPGLSALTGPAAMTQTVQMTY